MLKLGMISVNNIKDVLICLKDLEYNAEIRNILVALTNNPSLPEEIRESLKEVIKVNADEITKEEPILVGDNNQSQVTKAEQPSQTVVRRPQVGVSNREEEGISLGNDVLLGAVVGYAANRGIKVLSSDPGIVKNGEISFELDNESKPYIDNLLLSLYDQMDDVKVGMKRIASSGKEVLTLAIDNPGLSEAEIRQRSNEMFAKVNEVLHNTDKNKDYEEKMDPKLRALKDKFHNDDPNIPNEDFEIGYSRTAGENTYYIIANSKEQAIEVAELMGYEIKEDRGGNVFEVKDEPNMTGSKLDEASTPVDYIDEVKDVDDGLADIPVDYNDRHYGDNEYNRIEDFIRTNTDPSTMAVVQIDVPVAASNQRVVTLASSDGTRETIVFDNGSEFDAHTLPRIANAYGEGTTIDNSNATTIEYGNGKSGYDALSSDNTYLRLNNFDSSTIGTVDESLSAYKKNGEEQTYNQNTNAKAYSKTLGSYPTTTTNNQAANTNFFALVVFVLVLAIGFGVIYLMFGG
jgi:hypothetical protein